MGFQFARCSYRSTKRGDTLSVHVVSDALTPLDGTLAWNCTTSPGTSIFSDNFFDLLPGRPRAITFFKRAGAASSVAFVPASPGNLVATSMVNYAK